MTTPLTALQKAPTRLIILSGLLVGTLDILSAFVDYYVATGKDPLVILPFIASGVVGKSALSGGAGMMLMGLLFHYFFAFSFTVFFFWLYPRFPLLSRSRIITGIVYGIFIWLLMNLMVIQLSRAPHRPLSEMCVVKTLKPALILVCMIGLPLSFIAYRHFHGRGKN